MALDLVSLHLFLPLIYYYIIFMMVCQKWKFDNMVSLQWFFSAFKKEFKINHVPPVSHKRPLNSSNTIFSHFSKYAPCFSCRGPVRTPRMCFPSHLYLCSTGTLKLSSKYPGLPRYQKRPTSCNKEWTPFKQIYGLL